MRRLRILFWLPLALALGGCERNGTCIRKERTVEMCSVHYVKAACERTQDEWTWENEKAGAAHCRGLGFTYVQALNGMPMNEAEIDQEIKKDKMIVFFKR